MSYVKRAKRYAASVLRGKTPACQYVKQACRRFEADLKRKRWPYYLDEVEAERWCRFLELLPHTKGRWARRGETLALGDWQVFITVNLFGWRERKTKLRRFREAYIEVGRKNGKSTWVAGIGLGMLCLDDEAGAEVYCGATTEQQAWHVFRPARNMCLRTPALCERYGIDIRAKTILRPAEDAVFQPIIGDPGDGGSPSCAIADEFHEHPDAAQVDTMTTGMGAREQPLMIYITTAGSDVGGPCYQKRDDVLKVLKGTVKDEAVFGIVYTIDEKDRWDTVEALKKANPNYGVSADPAILEGFLRQARRSAEKQASYKTKHLNLWVGAKHAWMNLLAFQACRRKGLSLTDFRGERCFMGVDLASRVDIASLGIVFPPTERRAKWAAFFRRWVPEERILNAPEGDRYPGWHADGWLEATPGETIDFDYIEDAIKALSADFEIVEIAYDPFQATQFAVHMGEDGEGFPMVQYGATPKNFNEPMQQTEALILGRQMAFQLDPVLLWMMGNVVAKKVARGMMLPDKERSENKIDDVVTLIMAVGRAMVPRDEGTSVPDDYTVTSA